MQRWLFLILILIVAFLGILIVVEQYQAYWQCPLSVRKVLGGMETNRDELYEAVTAYQRTGNEQRLRALYFLLENMDQHSFALAGLKDSTGTKINYDISEFANLAEAEAKLDSLQEEFGELNFRLLKRCTDNQEMTAVLLSENIEEAFKAWKEFPWSRNYSEHDFLNYILPYRGSNEPLTSFRPRFEVRYAQAIKELESSTDIMAVAAAINEQLKAEFRFNAKYYLHPTDQSLAEMLESGEGRCEDMTNYAIYALRANGIAVTSDYTPYWADSDNNHAWNAIILPSGEALPFMGCESNPGVYTLRQRIAKVYRKMYARQQESLGMQLLDSEGAPAWLAGKNYLDVTRAYVPTVEVSLTTLYEVADSVRFVYLAVYNDGDWRAIAWGKLESGASELHDVGVDLVYLPVYYLKEKLEPAGEVFLLNESGRQEELTGNGTLQDMTLRSTTRMRQANLSEESDQISLQDGYNYELQYWESGWQSAGTQECTGKPLHFTEVPAGKLYRLLAQDEDNKGRIFIYRENGQIWY
ncbi:MAG: transglutaminase-like domain-containing protein [Candidatus Cloacimonetes bacterium]|nr:transglutaminase-like domain-containing protein [Candidatus Cloacimonadota bacterium]